MASPADEAFTPGPHGAARATVAITFEAVSARLKALDLPDCDVVVGIATGGTVPAALLAHQLDRPLVLVSVTFRAPDNRPQRPRPHVLAAPPRLAPGARALLVDDVSVTGATLATAAAQFPQQDLTTVVLTGRADIVAFPEIDSCVAWPWKT